MVTNIFQSPYFSGATYLRKSNPVLTGVRIYDDAVRGTNLIAKATQLVNDLEAARNQPSFEALSESERNRPFINGPQFFEDLVKDIVAQLKKDDKPLTVLNFIEARESLSTPPKKDIDIKT